VPKRAVDPTDEQRQRQAVVLVGLCKRSGLTMTQVAASIGISTGQLCRYETGHTILTVSYLPRMAETYGVSLSRLSQELGLVTEEDERVRRRRILERNTRSFLGSLDEVEEQIAQLPADEAERLMAVFKELVALSHSRKSTTPV